MANIRSVDFLPEIFRTDTNKQFLSATLDTLIQEPRFKKVQGYIGRTIGPGVNPNDRYVVELDKTRADYQLEPSVVTIDPETDNIKKVMTYPNINDALSLQGGPVDRPDRLYENDYYTWDPFVNFDTFVNFSQYYWLPNGPDTVEVSATEIPATDIITVNRQSGYYTFSGISGENPNITLIRGGTYTFRVTQNIKQTVNVRVSNRGTQAWIINGQDNPTLTLIRGNTYVFNLNVRGGVLPFWIKSAPTLGQNDSYNNGVSRNGSTVGLVTFEVPQDAPDVLYYTSENQSNLQGVFQIQNAVPGQGPKFWIQSEPGINGNLFAAPNISSRDVLGVTNNGEDLGIITFNVPTKTAQSFYYNLVDFNRSVDLVTGLKFDQINNQRLDSFLETYGGIDGIQSLSGLSLIFAETPLDTEAGGWYRTTFFDPLPRSDGSNGLPGSYDSTFYDQTEEIPLTDRQQLWQINLQVQNGIEYIVLSKIATIPDLQKFSVRYGTTYSNTQWYKNSLSNLERIPLLTAVQNTLYYQDGLDPTMFGTITLIDNDDNETLFIEDILGKSSYTSPNGVKFTNGLQVIFSDRVDPPEYGSGAVNINCTATSPINNAITTDSIENLYVGQQIIFQAPTLGGLQNGISYYVQSIVNLLQFTVATSPGGNAVTLQFGTGNMEATAINFREFYVSGVGTAIELLPVQDFITPETYVRDGDDSTLATEPGDPDYITIDRASRDRNAWSRSNRWFHVDVINSTAVYNNTVPVLDNRSRAKRPIIEFRPNLRLYNMGTEGKDAIDLIDFEQTDAFSNVEGATSYSVDGVSVENGTRIVFAADADPEVANKIFMVEFIIPDSIPPLIAQPVINLRLASDGVVLLNQNTVCLQGETTKGKTFWYDGIEWVEAQEKQSVQQAPLFDVYDASGLSFADKSKYPSSDFVGNKLFSYAPGLTNILDPVLGLPLRYLNIENVGDIVFDNNLYKDTFTYTRDNVSTTLEISEGYVREYASRTEFDRLIGWQNAITTSKQYQQFKFTYSSPQLKLDVAVLPDTEIPSLKIFVGSIYVRPDEYTYTVSNNSTTITLQNVYVPGDIIEVLALSDQISRVAFYQIPSNLDNNPLNANSDSFTLGTIRQHYQSICENLINLDGPINGANNSRDLGNLVPYGEIILQQSAPMTQAGYFLGADNVNLFESLIYNAREYFKYKNLILNAVTDQELQYQTAAEILDTAIESITQGRTADQPFYWSDMLPSGAIYQQTTYPITFTSIDTFDTRQVYDFKSSNFLGLNVYLNNQLLVRKRDYVVAEDGPRLTILVPLSIGDTVMIREYSTTAGSFCPNTPSKMGLYPAWEPGLVTVTTSNGSQVMIRGHDGSLTTLFQDIRDEALIEFERRIYNNIKMDDNPVPLSVVDVLPGQFRSTGYSFETINTILSQDFLSYVAWNKLDYRTQQYRATNEFTYNYSTATNKLNDSENLLGAWRGIYRYFYDTTQPDLFPWEMLGFSIKPLWWDNQYGAAPYTQENLVLWDDLADGLVRDPAGPYIRPQYARPRLQEVIPTGSQGELLPPLQSVTASFDSQQFRRSWQVGDGSPVEASWWQSSLYPFAVMRLLALTKPAKFFSLFVDRDLYKYDSDLEQYLYQSRYRLDANDLQIYGNGVSKASYINWIVDYNRQSGLDSTEIISTDLANLDVRLCYRMAGFSDKTYIKLFTEKSTPESTNAGFLIPDQSYNLLLFKNQPFLRAQYTAILVQKVPGGYAVFGYGTSQPYFNTFQSFFSGALDTFTGGGVSVQVPRQYSNTVVRVPYGFVFDNVTTVSDFILSYGEFCKSQGLIFDNIDNGLVLDWPQMVVEFLYWSQQGWQENSIIALNPSAQKISIVKEKAVVDNINLKTNEGAMLDQNQKRLPTRDVNIVRLDNTFTVEPLIDQTISYLDLLYTSYEHIIVLDNRSLFGDVIYDPITGARQNRLKLVASVSDDWNGSIDAPGFILNLNNIQEWSRDRTYTKGEIIRYKDRYWSAADIIQPGLEFNFNDWLQSDYSIFQVGMLPNLATKANQLTTSYDINTPNLEIENDLFSYGLIGFRPRQYMTSLNLDDVSQVNIYRQFLGTKGTRRSAELFGGADLGKERADYLVYENWAIKLATYGASENRRFVELRLNRALLNSNPSVIAITEPGQISNADQSILISDIWRQSMTFDSPNILPTVLAPINDSALPSAGYVNLEDADISVFNLDDPASLGSNLANISVGSSIWVAKVNQYDWNIYRVDAVPGHITHVCDNLDQTSLVYFTNPHNLQRGDILIIKFFDPEIDGVYRVQSVPGINSVTIPFSFSGDRTVVNGVGLGYTLESMRLPQFSDAVNLSYINNLLPGDKIWIDDDSQGRWSVLEKRAVFSSLTEIFTQELDAGELFGESVAQAANRYAVIVGAPGHNVNGTTVGGVFVYVAGYSIGYSPISPLPDSDAVLVLDPIGSRGYGKSVTFGNKAWAAAGAPYSLGAGAAVNVGYACVIYNDQDTYRPGANPYVNWQLLINPDNQSFASLFGFSVSMSANEKWLYIGAPGANAVYAYGRVDWQDQKITVEGDGSTTDFYIADVIQIDQEQQLSVSVNGEPQVLGIDYTFEPSDSSSVAFSIVDFITAPPAGSTIIMERVNSVTLDSNTYYSVSATNDVGTGIGALFQVDRRMGSVEAYIQSRGTGYAVNDELRIPAASFAGGVSPTNDLRLIVTAVSSGGITAATTIVPYVVPAGIPATNYSIGSLLFSARTIYNFTLFKNGKMLRPVLDYTFNSAKQIITLATTPSLGDEIVVRARDSWQYAGSITVNGIPSNSEFGYSVKTDSLGRQIVIGAPDQLVDGLIEAGSSYVFERNVQHFIYQPGAPNTFTVLGTLIEPVSVSLNGSYLINQTSSVLGAPNSFTTSGNVVTINADLVPGDTIEIETNQFSSLQEISQNITAEFSNHGQAVEICSNDCSIFVSSPQSSLQVFKGGVVEYHFNQSRLYGTITNINQDPVLTAGHTLRVNNIDVAIPAATPSVSSLQGLANAISNSVPNTTALVNDGRITIYVTNLEASTPTDRLQVAPGTVGTAFSDLGFNVYEFSQSIQSPYPTQYAAFGSSLSSGDQTNDLIVGAPQGTTYLSGVFDPDPDFDSGSTIFFSILPQSGSVYIYNFANSTNGGISNPPKFVFGQQPEISDLQYLDRFGSAVNYRSGLLWMGAPGQDLQDSTLANYGKAFVFENPNKLPAWQVIRQQQPVVDIRLLNSVFLYDRLSSATTEFLDFFDPLQGKILGAAQQNIDYIGAIDPAAYSNNLDTVPAAYWAASHVGEIWWDLSTVRFIDPNQDDQIYAARRWAQIFPGSSVDVYQWTVSNQLPANYTGPGIPYDVTKYTVNTFLGTDGVINTQYFFWVRNISSVATNKNKTLSTSTIARYIQDPRASGIAYLAPINASTVAIYNCESLIMAQDTVLHIEFDREFNNDNVHVEYQLIPQDRANGFLTDSLYLKFQDSLCGVDLAGAKVPDIFLSPPERYGVEFRPRQSMFIDRFAALRNYITRANAVLQQFPVAEIRIFNLLNSSEPEPRPDENLWNFRVANLEILSFQVLDDVPLGYRYLVQSDSTQRGRWTIYEVVPGSTLGSKDLSLYRVQNYVTPDYWSYIDWYSPGYNSSIRPVLEVQNVADLETVSVPVGDSVKVLSNAQGKFEIYLRTDTGYDRVGLEDGTIEISREIYDYSLGRFGFDIEVFDAQYFDQEPVIETRKIIQALNQEIFIDDLLIERNKLLVLMFNFALSETLAPEWLTKTSLIDVDHRIRALLPFQNYTRDNQEFVLDYIQEVKPYHVQIREFNIKYFGDDIYLGDVNDFDVPAYYNTALDIPQFTSPILLPYEQGTAEISNNLSDAPATSEIWETWPWNQWYNNYLLTLSSIEMLDSGTGYNSVPQVIIEGDAETPAQARAVLDGFGGVLSVIITDSGSGYRITPTISFIGGNGITARAYPVLTNGLVRQLRTTIKYDRYQYHTSVLPWSPEGIYENGTLVRYQNSVWRADNSDGSSANVGPEFNLEDWELVPASELSGVDRTMGYYVPAVNSPGLDLAQLVEGVSYPGVQVWGDYFIPTQELDVSYRSSFGDLLLGTRPTDINVDGGKFIGTYEGHAPEELVNGSEFDTLDLKVFTRPGSDWQLDGHGFDWISRNFEYDAILASTFSWDNLVDAPIQIIVSNVTTGLVLIDGVNYNTDWIEKTITIVPGGGSSDGDIINIAVFSAGGGSQLFYDTNIPGSAIPTGTFLIPVNASEISEVVIFINGQLQPGVPTFVPYSESEVWNILQSYPQNFVVNNSGIYYRSLKVVPIGVSITDVTYWVSFVPTLQTQVTMPAIPASTDAVSALVLAATTVFAENLIAGNTYTILTVGTTNFVSVGAASNTVGVIFVATGPASGTGLANINYSWSVPQIQFRVVNNTDILAQGITLTNDVGGTNPANMIVNRNGSRLTPPASIEWIADGSTGGYYLPQRLGASFQQSSINAATDIMVWVDDILQIPNNGLILNDYSVTDWDGSNTPGREVQFNVPPPPGSKILISVSTLADYRITGSGMDFLQAQNIVLNLGDALQIITWNDTAQQDLLTQVLIGPTTQGIQLAEGYDITDFDAASVSFTPGSFDYAALTAVPANNIDLGRPDVDAARLWVTLNGQRLFDGVDFTVTGSMLNLPLLNSPDILAVTMVTNSLVPKEAAFRIFQDMRGIQQTYRITSQSTTVLSAALSDTDDVIYVESVAKLTVPLVEKGILGDITIDGERIVYREIDFANNALKSLLRGAAGTAISSHFQGAPVYDIGRGNLLQSNYQDYIISDTSLGDGSTTIFYAPSIDISDVGDSSTTYVNSIEVFVGGVRQYGFGSGTATQYPWIVTDFGPLAIEFITDDSPVDPALAPPPGVEVTILQRRGLWWYAVATVAEQAQALQENDSVAARFLTNR